MAARFHLKHLASATVSTCLAASCLGVAPALATTMDDLNFNYQSATIDYRSAIVEQVQNGSEIVAVEKDIAIAESEIEQQKEELGNAAVTLYKSERHRSDLIDLVLQSSSVTDAITRYEDYVRIEKYYQDKLASTQRSKDELAEKKAALVEAKQAIKQRVADAIQAVEEAGEVLRDADHSDGATYHQKQGNGSNCGATSFIVGVNILLHENRYTNNVSVWKGPGFRGDSTTDLAFKGATWLMANGLSDQISIDDVPGDIHSTSQLRAELENAHVVVISSGADSVWQRADGSSAGLGTFPDGHWIVFYQYKDGKYYANDSSVGRSKGAGIAYTESQMQQWLDGRGNHFAVTLAKKSLAS